MTDGAGPDKPVAPLLAMLRGLNRVEMLSAGAILLVALIAWGYIATLQPTAAPNADMSCRISARMWAESLSPGPGAP